jgi:hypothetical protein
MEEWGQGGSQEGAIVTRLHDTAVRRARGADAAVLEGEPGQANELTLVKVRVAGTLGGSTG